MLTCLFPPLPLTQKNLISILLMLRILPAALHLSLSLSFPLYISPFFRSFILLPLCFLPVRTLCFPPSFPCFFSFPSPPSPFTNTSYSPLFCSPYFSLLLLLHHRMLSNDWGGGIVRDGADLLAVIIGAGAVTIHCPIKTVTSDIYCSSISSVVFITLLPGLASKVTLHCRLWTRGQCPSNAFIAGATKHFFTSVGVAFGFKLISLLNGCH